MSYPVYPEKHRLPALLTAEQMIEFRRAHGLREAHAPDGVVLCLYRGVMKRFGWKYRARRIDGFQADVYVTTRHGKRAGVVGNFGIGAPAATNLAEELIAWGAKRLVILSLAGGIQPDLAPGSLVVCDRAIRDEGTSYHYLPPARDVSASAELVARISKALDARGLGHVIGATWSTDAPYRETREEAASYQREGVKAVDMESAGVFAAAQVRGVSAASVLVVGDSLAGPRWSAPPDMRALHKRIETLLDTLIEVIAPHPEPYPDEIGSHAGRLILGVALIVGAGCSSSVESPRGQPVLHPNIDDALASGFASLVGRAPYATQLWLDDAAGFTARWDTDGDGAVDATGVRTQNARFTKPGVYEPSVTLSAHGRPDVTLRQRIVVLGDAPARSDPGRYGVNEDLGWDPPAQISSQITLMKDAGVQWVRLPVRWQWLEPQRGGYMWERYESRIDEANAGGLKLLAVLGGTPLWSSGVDRRALPRGVDWDSFEPRETRDFAAYVYRVVERFSGRISAYELMNEPNSPVHWNPRPNSSRFIELLCAGYLAAKYADPNAVIVAGGLNGNGLSLGWEAPESRNFLRAIYSGAGARCFDVMAIHPFAHPTENGVVVLQSWIDETKRFMAAQGDRRELWLTETGWSSGRSLWGHTTISEEQQADWVGAIYRDVVGPQKIFWYNFKEDRANPTDPEAQWGWLRYDLTPKPAFKAFSDLRRLGVTDATRPPRS